MYFSQNEKVADDVMKHIDANLKLYDNGDFDD